MSFIEKVLEKINERKPDLKIQGYKIRIIRLADDVILEENEKELEKPLKSIDRKLNTQV